MGDIPEGVRACKGAWDHKLQTATIRNAASQSMQQQTKELYKDTLCGTLICQVVETTTQAPPNIRMDELTGPRWKTTGQND
jgi:hypothetical protein